ncbi:cytochrome P450 [uncultured Phenylobacterium sp.]|uniref:cytochrome P450 n=1 Tax=uncultured Phenylobacterium sp. TaxID=349273 RepID=UPI0025DC3681|nr:cytochrome P450 [uncultured Phenylobacterium sp.]
MTLTSAECVATIVDPAAHADPSRLYPAYAWLRKHDPIARAELPGFDPFHVVTRHADIQEISKDNRLFPYGDLPSTLATSEGVVATREAKAAGRPLLYTLVQMDEPDHMKYRTLTQAWFMPANLRKLEGRIREIARESVARMESLGGRCDFVNEVALHYPLRVIMEILGVPAEDEPRMLQLTQELFGATDPDLARGGENQTDEARGLALQAVFADFFNYFNVLIEDRRARPRDDVASLVANAQIDGQQISAFDAISYYVIIATAGHDTTSSSTAGAMWALAERPGELAKVKANPALIPGLVDESIRWTTPVRHFMRSAAQDVTVAGQAFKQGDWFMLCYPSANRDEAVFEAPDEFRVDRSPNKHLAFGYGAHLCLGQHLAKMEMRILWEELLPRLQSVEIDGDAKLSHASFVNGPKTLPIRYVLA